MLIPFQNKKPVVHDTTFLAPGTYLIGDVKVGKETSIWFNAVLRGDEGHVDDLRPRRAAARARAPSRARGRRSSPSPRAPA